MRRVMASLLLLLTVVVKAAVSPSGAIRSALKEIPDVRARDITGRQIHLKSLADSNVLLVVFWATWCMPCAAEMKHIAKLSEDFGEQGLTVVAVSLDGVQATARVRQHVKANGWRFLVTVDRNDQLKQAFGVVEPPTVFVVSRGGTVVYSHTGFVAGDEKKLVEQVEAEVKKGN